MEINDVIFGGFGFLGRALAKRLVEVGRGMPVAADNAAIEPEEVTIAEERECDVRSPKAIQRILEEYRPKVIHWLPARQGYRGRYSDFARVQLCGAYGLFHAIDHIRGYQPEQIVLASSQAVYTPTRGCHESGQKRPPSIYGLSKLQQEKAFHWFASHRGIDLTALRYSIILGAGQALASTESGLIRNWYRALKRDRKPEIYGTGKQVRDFVHIDDAADATVRAIGETGTYNISGEALSILDAFSVWQRLSGSRDANVLGKDVRPGGEYSLTSVSGMALRYLHWEPRKSFENMVEDFLSWARARDSIESESGSHRREPG